MEKISSNGWWLGPYFRKTPNLGHTMPHTKSLVTSARILYLKLEDLNNAQAFLAMPYLPLLSMESDFSLHAATWRTLSPASKESSIAPLKKLSASCQSCPEAQPVHPISRFSAMHWPSPLTQLPPSFGRLQWQRPHERCSPPFAAPSWTLGLQQSMQDLAPRHGTWDDGTWHAWI